MDSLPFSQASENNKLPIHQVLVRHLVSRCSLLEIGGGTGQHAEFFAEHFPDLIWQSSDVPSNIELLNLRIAHARLPNLPLAISLDVNETHWHCGSFDAVFSANCLHIISEQSVENFFAGMDKCIHKDGLLLVYGPFKYDGEFTTESNAGFDVWLKSRNPVSGVRDFEWVNKLAQDSGLTLVEDSIMPANNQLLVWSKL
jgi:cyclopropane fatty-acyl-phospholipid synthase-like methyltransferase